MNGTFKFYVLKSEFMLVALRKMQLSPGGQEPSAVAHRSDDQSMDEGSGDREKEEEMFQKGTQWAGCQAIRGEAKARHVRNAAKARCVTSHHLLTIR